MWYIYRALCTRVVHVLYIQSNTKQIFPTTNIVLFVPHPTVVHHDHTADPRGMHVASSLPTALMQPNVMAAADGRSGVTNAFNVNDR